MGRPQRAKQRAAMCGYGWGLEMLADGDRGFHWRLCPRSNCAGGNSGVKADIICARSAFRVLKIRISYL